MNYVLRLVLTVFLVLPVLVEARPKIGLVLSGGGARGTAHIGVLRYLEEQNIPIDVISATSMGAIVGGLYASGLSVDEIERITLQMDWTEKLIDNVPRQERSIQRKRIEDLFSIPGSLGFNDGEIKIPSGAIQGQNIILELQRITQHVSHITEFDQLPIPFIASTTNIVTGQMVLLDHGDLAIAMRASMGVPAIFAPILVEGELLVDGGITNNLPMDVARKMGADILIVVDISSPLLDKNEVGNLISITDQLTRMLTRVNTMQQIDTLASDDIFIVPEMGDISSADFDKAAQGIARGYTAAVESAALLKVLSVAGDHRAIKPVAPQKKIMSITLDNTSGLNDEVINHLVKTTPGEILDLDQLESELTRVHGLGNFEQVGYRLAHVENGIDLGIEARSKSWGPNFLHFGIDAESEFSHDSRITLLLGYTREEVTDKGAEWTSFVGLGDEPTLQTLWYQPLSYKRDWFFLARAGLQDEVLSEYIEDEKVAEFSLSKVFGFAGIGYEFGSSANVVLGLSRTSGEAELVIGDPGLEDSEFEDGGVILRYLYDTRDDIDLPTRGLVLDLNLSASMDLLGADEEFQQWELLAGKFFSWGHHSLGLGVTLGGTSGVGNVDSVFRLGGWGKITGLLPDQLKGNYKGIVTAVYYRRYGDISIFDGFIGSILEYGGAWDDRADISTENSIFSAGVFIGADTPIGVLQIGAAATDEGDTIFFSRIGRVF